MKGKDVTMLWSVNDHRVSIGRSVVPPAGLMIRSIRTLMASAPLLGVVAFLPLQAHAADSLGAALARLAPSADPKVIGLAVQAAECAQSQGGAPSSRLAVIDYSKPSSEPRLWVFDTVNRNLLFQELVASRESQAQRHIFFGERATTKIADIPADTPIYDIRSVGVVGAGTMGTGIAISFLSAGYPVALVETKREALDRGVGMIQRNFEQSVKKRRISAAQFDRALALLTPTLELGSLASTDLIVEAAFEDFQTFAQQPLRFVLRKRPAFDDDVAAFHGFGCGLDRAGMSLLATCEQQQGVRVEIGRAQQG